MMTYWHVAYFAFGFTTGFMTGMMAYFMALRREQETNKFLSAATIGDEKMPLERILRKSAEGLDDWGEVDYFPPTVYSELENL